MSVVFDAGSQKTLAAFVCWLGLIALSYQFDEADFGHLVLSPC